MKPIQWIIAVVVLVLMVFAVTIVMNFLGEGSTATTGTAPPPENRDPILAFLDVDPNKPQEVTSPAGIFPDGHGYNDQELNPTGGYHDFLFENPTGEEVTVSMNRLSCHCASVSLFLSSTNDEWRQSMARWAAAKTAEAACPPMMPVGFVGAADAVLAETTAKVQPLGTYEPDKAKDKSFTVPPRTVGWFRVTWPGDKNGTNTYTATLETRTKSKQGGVDLKAKVRWVNPAYLAEPILNVGEIKVTDLEKAPHIQDVVVFSATRPKLRPTATLVTKWKTDESPIVVGQPEFKGSPYTKLLEDMARPQQTGAESLVLDRINCAYHIPVQFLAVSKDGARPMPLGRFRARVRVDFADEGLQPLVCLLYGIVYGNVKVTGEGKFDFGTFSEDSGSAPGKVLLYTEADDVVLEIDKEHTWPRLVNSELKVTQDEKEKQRWTLEAQLLPHSGVKGRFPREDDDEYFDTAVYVTVKAKGDKTRSLRIPSGGTAN